MKEQEEFWSGEFGDEYIDRNTSEEWVASNSFFFSKVFSKAPYKIKSLIEFGPNIGLNLIAIKRLFPKIDLHGVEINKKAANILLKEKISTVSNSSILNYNSKKVYDVSLIKGVLIHLNPEDLTDAYEKLYNSASKYIVIAEYYNPTPVTIKYRGHENKLFKRDFAGEIMNKYPNLELIDYGFSYHLDKNFPQDDITWFLLKK
tara:strand:+ start:373 stop:981 length:609 start_codon:yes stop_codon:yes gene_type:complete